jgi:glycosyltransferase involved in cell wall biosynthesis
VITVHAGPNFDPEAIAGRPSRARAAHAPTILFVGREFDRKGGPVLLDAFRRVRAQLPNAKIAHRRAEDARRTGARRRVPWLPAQERACGGARLAAAFADADVFCLPTRHEPFGIVVLEAMFNGLPVVATNIWAIPEMVVEGETGFTVARDDAATLADRLARLLAQPNSRSAWVRPDAFARTSTSPGTRWRRRCCV